MQTLPLRCCFTLCVRSAHLCVQVDRGVDFAVLATGLSAATLRLNQLPPGHPLTRGTAYGRVAFSCPAEQLQSVQEEVAAAGFTVQTPLVSLDTPGKARVQVGGSGGCRRPQLSAAAPTSPYG